jgi:hypothetical protein
MLAASLATASSALANDLSGTWVAKGAALAVMIQIVETDGGNVTGRYAQVALQSDGKLTQMDAAITGATDGQTAILTIKPAELFSGSVVASGTVSGSALHLTGSGGLALNLVKSDQADFQAQANALAQQSREKNAEAQAAQAAQAQEEEVRRRARADAARLAALQDLTKRLSDFTAYANAQLPKFASLERRYRSVTESMRNALAREESIRGASADASIARNQITIDINQAGIDSDQMHTDLQSAKQNFDNASAPLTGELSDATRSCATAIAISRADENTSKSGRIGVAVTTENGSIKVVSATEGFPAAQAGVRTNDLIIKIDGEPVEGMTLAQASDKMRGAVHTPITLSIVREGTDKPFDVTLVREAGESEKSACLRFAEASRRFQSQVDAVRQAFAKTESVWLQERSEQERIVRASGN